MTSKKIITEGMTDVTTWAVLFAATVLAVLSQLFRAAGLKPPLTTREVLLRSGGAGVAALTFGLLLMGAGKLELHWALLMGLGGVIGYWGQEALALVVEYLETRWGSRRGKGDGDAG